MLCFVVVRLALMHCQSTGGTKPRLTERPVSALSLSHPLGRCPGAQPTPGAARTPPGSTDFLPEGSQVQRDALAFSSINFSFRVCVRRGHRSAALPIASDARKVV